MDKCEICGMYTDLSVIVDDKAHVACRIHLTMYYLLAEILREVSPTTIWDTIFDREQKKRKNFTEFETG